VELELQRIKFDTVSCEGYLLIDGASECYTLELPVKDGLPGSAIPQGRYAVIVTFSPKFDRDMPLIAGIPNRSDIRIHWGNDPHDTNGCLLVGKTMGRDFVGSSRIAFNELWAKIEAPARAGQCYITVSGGTLYSGTNTETVQRDLT
jgi:hypothetical protein